MESDLGKLFIGGISWDTNEERLKEYFSNYGDVVEAVIMKDRTTGRARGFGFVVFSDPAVAERVVMEKHTIDGRTFLGKINRPRLETTVAHGSPGPTRTKKIFVGGLASTVTEADFRSYFEQFGTITDVVVMYDHNTQRPRGFGFITYDSEDAVDNVLVKTFHELNGKMVEVKRAVPKEQINSFLNGYTQGYSPSPVTGYGMRMDMRLGQVANGRGRFSPFSPGFGMGMNFEQGLSPSYGGNASNGSSISYGRGISPFYNGNSNKFGNPSLYGSTNAPGSVLSSMARNTWGNGGLNHAANTTNDNSSFLGTGSAILSGFGNGGVNWGDSTSPVSGQGGGSSQGYSGINLGYSSGGDSSFGLGGSNYGRRNRIDSAADTGYSGSSGGYNGTYGDLYGGSSIYGDPTWRSSSLELDGSGPFDYGLGNAATDVSTKSSDGYMGAFNVRQ
ncbi:unnamed protein product [Spirodela intermedia]|uniref:RRM domain-containing protein n=1 Tax=Spirodela intermedia TaxID=51605 RepID=A0A7I8JB45_SPIIN|nr:unnamed protein product [Spirodela intermedia]CAA6667340.1 unnamed protein product [Spirodela intermedia]